MSVYDRQIHILLRAHRAAFSPSITLTDPCLVDKDLSSLALIRALPFVYLQLHARKKQIQNSRITTSPELYGDKIASKILGYAAETVDVIIAEPDDDLVSNYKAVASDGRAGFVVRPVATHSNGQILYVPRREVKPCFVCKHWRYLVNEMVRRSESACKRRASSICSARFRSQAYAQVPGLSVAYLEGLLRVFLSASRTTLTVVPGP